MSNVFGALAKEMMKIGTPMLRPGSTDRLRIALNDKDHAGLLREMEGIQTMRDAEDQFRIISRIKVLGIQVCRDNEEPDLEE